MMSLGRELVEKIDRIYMCKECSMVFLFKADAEEHSADTSHQSMNEMPFE